MTEQFIYGYEKHPTRHIWWIKGSLGAVHVWAEKHSPEAHKIIGANYFGGIECHSKKQQYDWQTAHENCWLLNGRCYSDGSSLQFMEQILPYLPEDDSKMQFNDPLIQSILHDRYQHWLTERDEP
jgi:hypothetical protein